MAPYKQKAPHKMTVPSADSSRFQYQQMPSSRCCREVMQGRFKGVCNVLCMASAVYVYFILYNWPSDHIHYTIGRRLQNGLFNQFACSTIGAVHCCSLVAPDTSHQPHEHGCGIDRLNSMLQALAAGLSSCRHTRRSFHRLA